MKHIILASDNNYAIPCMVTIASLLCNNDPKDCDIHILTKGFNEENLNVFEQLRKRFEGVSITTDIIENISEISGAITSHRFPISNFFRLLIPSLYDFKKVLYLDCDIIVKDNIDGLWNTDLNGYACGMVEDQACEDITLHNRIHKYTPYYNAGVLLMNLEVWKKENIVNKLIDFMNKYPERCLYPDQDAINSILFDRIKPIPYRYNCQERWYEPQQAWLMHRDKWEHIENAKKNPAILHYTGPIKPWVAGCSHPLAKLFFKYKKTFIDIINNEEEDRIKCQQIEAQKRDETERKRKHKHIRRANLFTILFLIETIAFIIYAIFFH